MKLRQVGATDLKVRRTAQPRVTDDQVQEALSWLHPMLLTALKNLSSAPPSVIDAAIQILPVASKIAMRQGGLVAYTADSDESCPNDQRAITLTALGQAVIDAAAVELTGVADWSKRAQAVVEANSASESTHMLS